MIEEMAKLADEIRQLRQRVWTFRFKHAGALSDLNMKNAGHHLQCAAASAAEALKLAQEREERRQEALKKYADTLDKFPPAL